MWQSKHMYDVVILPPKIRCTRLSGSRGSRVDDSVTSPTDWMPLSVDSECTLDSDVPPVAVGPSLRSPSVTCRISLNALWYDTKDGRPLWCETKEPGIGDVSIVAADHGRSSSPRYSLASSRRLHRVLSVPCSALGKTNREPSTADSTAPQLGPIAPVRRDYLGGT